MLPAPVIFAAVPACAFDNDVASLKVVVEPVLITNHAVLSETADDAISKLVPFEV